MKQLIALGIATTGLALGMGATGFALAGTHRVSAKTGALVSPTTGAQTPKSSTQTPKSSMTFFITSVGSGKGGDLGGLKGADRSRSTFPDPGSASPESPD